MIAAFADGGCFHSRTAVGMYPHVKNAVESGEVLLEWDYSKVHHDPSTLLLIVFVVLCYSLCDMCDMYCFSRVLHRLH